MAWSRTPWRIGVAGSVFAELREDPGADGRAQGDARPFLERYVEALPVVPVVRPAGELDVAAAVVARAVPAADVAEVLATEVATAGFYQLRWYSARPVELEESRDPDFSSAVSIYRGSDAARVMSGKPDGVLYYRVRDTDDGTVSNVVEVTVRHHSPERAFAFFSLGMVIFEVPTGVAANPRAVWLQALRRYF